jgi:hypothetical protein
MIVLYITVGGGVVSYSPYQATPRAANGGTADRSGTAEPVQDVIAFFYDLLRDFPEVVAKVNAALEARYGHGVE